MGGGDGEGRGETDVLSRRTSGSQCSEGLGGGGWVGWRDCCGVEGALLYGGVCGGGGSGGPVVVGVWGADRRGLGGGGGAGDEWV